ncbi:hypothetical protein BTO27_04605 [Wolbachia pipientis wAus]|nr:hypothetical protein [Wolbachia endosymbiont of Rhagoletis cerasi]PBQ26340.1 hypothetical protein BTO27_04605 [Wolbachia pipientis wAus]QEK89858.1 hypothetical protein CAI20_04085 [Wolbachia endosymbiont of Chrysomya megacephala]CQD07000.1 Uncharacterised protein [Wolbachia endosymbiont wPip_Mol of Culex molestus]
MYDFGFIILAPLNLVIPITTDCNMVQCSYNVIPVLNTGILCFYIRLAAFILINLVSNLDARGLCCIAGEKLAITDKIHYKIAI